MLDHGPKTTTTDTEWLQSLVVSGIDVLCLILNQWALRETKILQFGARRCHSDVAIFHIKMSTETKMCE